MMLLYRLTLAAPLIVTVPALVRAFCRTTLPVMANSPPLAIVNGLPPKAPPDQLNEPLIVTALVKLIDPLVILMVSFEDGTPTGAQLLALNQSLEAVPVQVKLAA